MDQRGSDLQEINEFDAFQYWAQRKSKYQVRMDPTFSALGVAKKGGEIADSIQQLVRFGKMDEKNLEVQIGACLWYLAQLCSDFNLRLGEVAANNIKSLPSEKVTQSESERSRAKRIRPDLDLG